MSARSLPAGWTRSYVDWHRAQEPARFEADMAEMREMADRALSVQVVRCRPFPALPAPMSPVIRTLFSLLHLQASIVLVQLAGDLADFRRLAVSIAASGPSAVDQRALVAARVFGAL